MITFDFITIFPEIVRPYFEESLFKKAIEKKLLRVRCHNLRDHAADKHHKVDDSPYGGGFGMVMKVEVWHKAIARSLCSRRAEKFLTKKWRKSLPK